MKQKIDLLYGQEQPFRSTQMTLSAMEDILEGLKVHPESIHSASLQAYEFISEGKTDSEYISHMMKEHYYVEDVKDVKEKAEAVQITLRSMSDKPNFAAACRDCPVRCYYTIL